MMTRDSRSRSALDEAPRSHRMDVPVDPQSLLLGRWIHGQATRYRSLLLTIEAAPRPRTGPVHERR